MKKKNITKALLALAIAPCFMLAGTGCGEDEDKGLSAEQKNTAYATLLTNLNEEKFFNPNATSNAIIVESIKSTSQTGDYSQSGIPADRLEEFTSENDLPYGEKVDTRKTEHFFGYKNDNTGYAYTKKTVDDKNSDNEELETESYKVTEQEFVKKEGNDYRRYSYTYNSSDPDYKYVHVVDDKYAGTTYKDEAGDGADGEFGDFLEMVSESATLDDLNGKLKDLAVEMFGEFEDNFPPETDITKDLLTTSLDVTLKDGVYSLILTMQVKDCPIIQEDGYSVKININASIIISFDNDSLEEISKVANIGTSIKFFCQSVGCEVEGVTFNSSNYVTLTSNTSLSTNIDLNNTFEESVLTQSTEGYVGTGTDGAVEGARVEIDFAFVDFDDVNSEGDIYKCKDLLSLDSTSGGFYDDPNVTKTFYWDEACTQEVEDDDVAPSVDTTIYVKLTPAEGYAVIRAFRGSEDDEHYGSSFGVFQIAGGKYIIHGVDMTEVTKILVNGVEVTDFAEGITFEQGGIYTIEYFIPEVEEEE